MKRLSVLLCVLFVASGPAHAGIADSPLPTFSDGKPSVPVMSVTGVVKRNRLQTDFLCTSLHSSAIDIGVEVFASDGTRMNDVGAGAGAILNLSPGETVTIGTGATATYLESAVIPLAGVSQGSARIVASSSQVRCNVAIVDNAITPPLSLATLGEGVRPAAGALPATAALPQFSDNQPATHAALFPGVIKRGNAETVFVCTSLASANINVGVQVFDPSGSVANEIHLGNGAVLNVAPGATVTLGTTGSAALLETALIAIPGVAQGLGRVVSTSGELTCAALVLDAALAPPAAMSSLAGWGADGGGAGPTFSAPLPVFSDQKPSVNVMTVPGVMKRGRLQTEFICTSVASVPVDIGVEIFALDGTLLNDVGAGVGGILNVAPGQTVTIGTSTTATYLESAVIPLASGLQGAGRIVASSDQVRCNVMLVDDLQTPPVTLATLGPGVQPAPGAAPSTAPLPQFSNGHQATHAAYVPGLVKRRDAETDVFCTSLAAVPIDIGVQVFRPNGTLANTVETGNGALASVAPGNTVTFGTTGTAVLFESTVISLTGIAQGLARIVSNSGQLLCSAVTLDAALSPPRAMAALAVSTIGVAVSPTPTATPSPTGVATATRTRTRTRTATRTPTRTATPTPTATLVATPTVTRTGTSTSTPPHSPAPTRTASRTPTATRSATATRTATRTITATRTATRTVPATSTRTATESRTVTASRSPTRTATATRTATVTPTRTATASPPPGATATARRSVTATRTGTETPVATPTRTATMPASRTSTLTPTALRTGTSTVTPARTATGSPRPSLTATATPTASATQGRTATLTPTRTRTATSTSLTPAPAATITVTPQATATRSLTPADTATTTPTLPASPTPAGGRTPTATVRSCAGDCRGDGRTSIDELITGVGITLGNLPLEQCPAFDIRPDGAVTIDELVAAVNAALKGCGSLE